MYKPQRTGGDWSLHGFPHVDLGTVLAGLEFFFITLPIVLFCFW